MIARVLNRLLFLSLLAFSVNARAEDPANSAPPPTLAAPPAAEKTVPQGALPTTPLTPQTSVPTTPDNLKSIANNANTKLAGPKAEEVLPPPEFDKTLMFDAERLKEYKNAYDAYEEKQKNKTVKGAIEDKIGSLLPSDDKLLPPPAGIYLNSILYRDGQDGVAWINQVKYKLNEISDGIKLVGLTSTTATIEWKTPSYDVDFKAWSDNFPGSDAPDSQASNLPPNKQGIKVDTGAKSIIFTLRPNQNLNVADMAIREGVPVAKPKESKPDAAPKPAPTGIDQLVNKAKQAVADEIPAQKVEDKPVVPDPNADKTAVFHRSIDGGFNIPAKLNDGSITFKADTGATITAISSEDAVKIGIDVTKLDYKYDVTLADGSKVKAAEANIENFTIEPIEMHNINILIAQGTMAQPLLGMSFFSKLKKFTIEGDTLTLYQ